MVSEEQGPASPLTGSTLDSRTDERSPGPDGKRKGARLRTTCASEYAGNLTVELLCGVTVALALVPEAVAFALAAGLPPAIGLNSAWIIAIFTAIVGGRPAMICGATGSLAVLVGDTVKEDGVEYLFYAVMLMGLLEILLGLLRIGALVKLIPVPVMVGFCNGLALVIGLAQFNNYKDPAAGLGGSEAQPLQDRRLGSFDAFTDGRPWISGMVAVWAALLTVLAFVICMFLPKLTTKVPSALVAIAVGTALEWGLVRTVCASHTTIVSDIAALGGTFPIPLWFDSRYVPPPLGIETLSRAMPLAATMAAVGLLESLMTLNLVDELTKTRGDANRECLGQGIANIICGALGGMGGCAMIGQSMINISSGARKRVSSLTAGLGLLLINLVAYPAINIIPVSALVGVMFTVVFHTFEWRSLKWILLAALPESLRQRFFSATTSKQKIRRADAVIILVVTLVTLFTNLATAVGVGMVLSFFWFALESSELISVVPRSSDGNPTADPVAKTYDVHGILFFGSTTRFLEFFDEAGDPDEVRLVFQSGYVADYSAVDALNKLAERYGALGKRVTIQELKPRSSKILRKASGLLVEELEVEVVHDEEELPREREHFNVETSAGIASGPLATVPAEAICMDVSSSSSGEESGS